MRKNTIKLNSADGSRWTHIVRRKITGTKVSRHTSAQSACRAVATQSTDRDPLDVIMYSEEYWREM